MPFELTFDDSDLKLKLKELDRAVLNTRPFFEEVGEIVKTSVVRNFEVGGRYSAVGSWRGGPRTWLPTVAVTGRKILIDKGLLMGSINWRAGLDSVEIGSNLVYAAIHNFGGQAGRNRSVTIPGRPYLVVQEEDIEQILQAADNHILGNI